MSLLRPQPLRVRLLGWKQLDHGRLVVLASAVLLALCFVPVASMHLLFPAILCFVIAVCLFAWGGRAGSISLFTAIPVLLLSVCFLSAAFSMTPDERFYIGWYAVPLEYFACLGVIALWPLWVSPQTRADHRVYALFLALTLGALLLFKIPATVYASFGLLWIAGLAGFFYFSRTIESYTGRRTVLFYFGSLFVFFLIIQLQNAWISEDAYITFRTIDNFMHGYGLTWNPGERVQAFTHPLWLFVLCLARCLSRDFYFSTLLVSVFFSLLSVVVIMVYQGNHFIKALLAVLFFSFSKAFVDYSTSGLENPLLFFLAALFLYALQKPPSLTRFTRLALIACLSSLTRLDTALLYFPALLFLWHETPVSWNRKLFRLGLAFSPLAAWEIFSLIYYGLPFPNTAYAKLNTAIPKLALIGQGLAYLKDSVIMDPVTPGLITLALVLPWFPRMMKPLRALSLGILLYLAYLIIIGGDFMSGRFLAVPYVWAVGILLTAVQPNLWSVGTIFFSLFLLSFISPDNPWNSSVLYSNAKTTSTLIADERGFYYPQTGLLPVKRNHNRLGKMEWIDLGRQLKKNGETFYVHPNVGLLGFYAGPGVHIVDQFALTEPFLSHLPAMPGNWRIGHFLRMLPEGYLETLSTGKNRLTDPVLAAFYTKIRLITRAALWDKARWKAILDVNLGHLQKTIRRDYYQAAVRLPRGRRYLLLYRMHERASSDKIQKGIYLALAGDWEGAAQLWQAVLTAEPDHYAAIADLAVYYEHQEKLFKAIQLYYEVARAFGSPWTEYYHSIRTSLNRQDRQLLVDKIGQPAIRNFIEPHDASPYAALIRKSIRLSAQRDAVRMKDLLLEAKAMRPDRPEAYANLGVLYEWLGERRSAKQYYRIAAVYLSRPWSQYVMQVKVKAAGNNRRPPKPSLAHYQDRQFLRTSGKHSYERKTDLGVRAALRYELPAAEKLLREAMAMDPTRPEAIANLAIVLELQGNYRGALDCYEQAAGQLGPPWTLYLQQLRRRLGLATKPD